MGKANQGSLTIRHNDAIKSAVLRWWQGMMLSADELKAKHIPPAPSGLKARLKRCESIDAAMLSEGFRSLWFSLPTELTDNARPADMERWATIAAALVYVQQSSEVRLAMAAGARGNGDKSVVSELRFAQLQSAKTPDEFLRRLRRILLQLKGQVAVLALAQDIEQWFVEQHLYRPRKAENRIAVQWAMDYYRAAGGSAGK
ncbi:type I-E CRISPR-associated protein Cse2/CasB [Marinobacter sp. X15-166B]|uniref:type I-E CRISPR-associated protein Cse2/CasB n=1 Tax=Marinobacter sp. X15-166B TaxID=1897620 RepID=UPI00085CBBDB|nr:type I-E CRISPR-associated protein Cse2/CasB [Marinobacter sp. X15-166B]OEY65568.1 type I-E CRISPR-associated protein Cse2/CasB [Marinobacter sp. X15-166B]